MSAKGRILGALGPVLLTEARVLSVEAIVPSLRRIVLGGEALRRARWHPGDKVQVVLAGHLVRTYTPSRWDAMRGETELLHYAHGKGPGAEWGRSVRPGDAVRLFGPRGSLRSDGGPVALFGDETTLGLAVALAARAILEVSEPAVGAAAAALLPGTSTFAVDGDRHFDALVDALIEAGNGATLMLAGRARSIAEVRRRLTARGVPAPRLVRPYWADGKVGLD